MVMVVEPRNRDRRIVFGSSGPRAVQGDAATSIADRESTRIVFGEGGPQVVGPEPEGDPSARVCFGPAGPIVHNGDGTVERPVQSVEDSDAAAGVPRASGESGPESSQGDPGDSDGSEAGGEVAGEYASRHDSSDVTANKGRGRRRKNRR